MLRCSNNFVAAKLFLQPFLDRREKFAQLINRNFTILGRRMYSLNMKLGDVQLIINFPYISLQSFVHANLVYPAKFQ